MLGRLRHPGIAQIFEASNTETDLGPQPYLVMELIKGQRLTEYAETRGLSSEERLGLFVKVCDAVEYAHGRGVIHCDLKPANILVDEYAQPKILDFGVARTITDEIAAVSERPEADEIAGTIPYMSPEQVAGDPEEIDFLTDVYSLGVICFELLSGSLPFDPDVQSASETARFLRESNPRPLGSISDALRGDIETIVAVALEKDKTVRYSSAAAFAAAIRRHLSRTVFRRPRSTGDRKRPQILSIPFSRPRFFTGREKVLGRLRAKLTRERKAEGPSIEVLCGLGGIGKTQTAVEYAYRYSAAYEAVFCARAETRDQLLSSFMEFGDLLQLSAVRGEDLQRVAAQVKSWFEENDDWLLIFDNVDDPEILDEFLPSSSNGHVLLTSRARDFRAHGVPQPIELEPLTSVEAVEFLFESTGADETDTQEMKAATELANELGCLPLALEQAAAVVGQSQMLFQDYLTAYRRLQLTVLDEATRPCGQNPNRAEEIRRG